MSTTRAVGRRLLWESMGGAEYVSLTPSANGGVAGATLIDTQWAARSDDTFNNWFIVLPLGPAGATSYQFREVSDFTGSTGTFTPLTAFSAQVTTAASYELLRYNPALFHVALNRAADLAFPDVYFPRRDESLMVDNLLSNWDFETYSSGFTSWSNVGTPTIAQETNRVWQGSNAASITASGAEEGLSQNLFNSVNVTEMVSKTLHVVGRVWASVASAARLRVTFDGSTYTNGPWHGGASEWEGPGTMFIDVAIPLGATQVTVICSVADGQVAYFDAVGAWVDTRRRYTVPTAFAKVPSHVSVQRDRDDPLEPYWPVAWHIEYSGETRYIILDELPPSGYILRVEGYAALSQMTADTDTVELSSPQRELWIAHAAVFLYRALWDAAAGQDRADYEKGLGFWAGQVKYLESRPGMRTVAQPHQDRRPWHWV